MVILPAAAQTRRSGPQSPLPPLLARLCDTTRVPTRTTSDDYQQFVNSVRVFLAASAPLHPESPCVYELPAVAGGWASHVESWEGGDFGSPAELPHFLIWGYAQIVLDLERTNHAPQGLRSRLRTALSHYNVETEYKYCLVPEFDFALVYVDYLLGKDVEQRALEAFSTFESISTSGSPCKLTRVEPDGDGLGVEAEQWGNVLLLLQTARSAAENPKNLRALNWLLGSSAAGVKKTFFRRWMLSHPLLLGLVKNAASPRKDPVNATFHLNATQSASAGGTVKTDKDLGSEIVDHRRLHDWVDPQYGEVYSQADIIVHFAGKLPEESTYVMKVSSYIRGGYDPPWPGKTIATRGAVNRVSALDFTLSGRFTLAACPSSDLTCFAPATVIITLAEAQNPTAEGDVLIKQGAREIPTRLDEFGGLRADINRAQGLAEISLSLRRADQHEGACCAAWVRQYADIYFGLNSMDDRARSAYDKPSSILADWYQSVGPDAGRFKVTTKPDLLGWALTHTDHAIVPDAEQDRYDVYARLLFGDLILRSTAARLTAAQKAGIEKAQLFLSNVSRRYYTQETRRHAAELRNWGLLINTLPLDLAIADLLLATPPRVSQAMRRVDEFYTGNRARMGDDENALLRTVLDSEAKTDHKTLVNATLALIRARRTLATLRDGIRDDLVERSSNSRAWSSNARG